jgi:Transcriptional regulators|nr:Lrp/AsnC family transcriptional regulator [uncultured Steroidobacter sp.]
MKITLDHIDRKIIALLQEDGSLSIADLAKKLHMTTPPCWRRVRRLKDAGVLERQVWLVNGPAIGFNAYVYAAIKLATHDSQAVSRFRERIKTWPEVLECYVLLGAIDVLVKIVVPDIQFYEDFFFKKLSQLPGVREVNSSVVMSEIKRTTKLPASERAVL